MSDDTKTVHVRVDIEIWKKLKILCGRARPYPSITDCVRYSLENELSQYDNEDIDYYRQIAMAQDPIFDE